MKKRSKNIFFLLLFLILNSAFCYAAVNSQLTEHGISDFEDGKWEYNSVPLGEFTTSNTRAFTDAVEIVYHADIDGDNVSEIIVNDDGQIEIYNITSNTLQIETSFTYWANVNGVESVLALKDIDSDGLDEILFSAAYITPPNDVYLYAYEWDGENLTQEFNHSIATTFQNGDDLDMICDDAYCYTAYFNSDDLYITSWDENSLIDNDSYNPATAGRGCFPKHSKLDLSDMDSDSNTELTIFFADARTAPTDDSFFWITYDVSSGVMSSETAREILTGEFFDGTNSCPSVSANFTNLVVYNFDQAQDGSRSEGFFAYIDDGELQGELYSYSGSKVDNFLKDEEVTYISNAFRGQLDPNFENTAYCVMGVKKDENIFMECEDEISGQPDTLYTFLSGDTSGIINPDNVYKEFSKTFFVGSMEVFESELLGITNDITETVSGFGVGYNIKTTLDASNEGSMGQLYTFGYDARNYYPIGTDSITFNDLLIIDNASLIFINDTYINPEPVFYGNVSPPVSNIRNNTFMNFDLYVEDADSEDLVSARVCLYVGDPDQYCSLWAANNTNPAFISISIIANKTIEGGVLEIYTTDNKEPFINNTYTTSMNVRVNGLTSGISCVGLACNPDDFEEEEVTEVEEVNAVQQTAENVSETLGIETTAAYVLFMFVLGVGLFIFSIRRDDWDLNAITTVIGGIELLALIFGLYMGFLPTSLLFIIIAIAMTIAGLYLGRLYTNG